MESRAEAGRIYLTVATTRRTEGFFALENPGEFRVKGVSAPVRVYALEGLGALRNRGHSIPHLEASLTRWRMRASQRRMGEPAIEVSSPVLSEEFVLEPQKVIARLRAEDPVRHGSLEAPDALPPPGELPIDFGA
jgi:hypothetical protein